MIQIYKYFLNTVHFIFIFLFEIGVDLRYIPSIDRKIHGLMESARKYVQQRIKTAMLSQGVAGFSGKTQILTLTGSRKAVDDSKQALFPQILQIFQLDNIRFINRDLIILKNQP